MVKRIHANGLKHQTLPLMGATRLASGLKQGLTDRRVMSAVCEPAVSVWNIVFPRGTRLLKNARRETRRPH